MVVSSWDKEKLVCRNVIRMFFWPSRRGCYTLATFQWSVVLCWRGAQAACLHSVWCCAWSWTALPNSQTSALETNVTNKQQGIMDGQLTKEGRKRPCFPHSHKWWISSCLELYQSCKQLGNVGTVLQANTNPLPIKQRCGEKLLYQAGNSTGFKWWSFSIISTHFYSLSSLIIMHMKLLFMTQTGCVIWCAKSLNFVCCYFTSKDFTLAVVTLL